MGEIEGLDQIIDQHPFFRAMSPESRQLIAGCASNAVYRMGDLIFREGDPADQFYLLRHGSVSLELHVPGRQTLVVGIAVSRQAISQYHYAEEGIMVG